MAKIVYGKHTYGSIKIIGIHRKGLVKVGNYCSIAKGVRAFLYGDHRVDNITTYPFGHVKTSGLAPSLSPDRYMDERERNIEVGNDVWVGFGAVLFRGVKIGDGAVIGAYAVITKDISPFSVAVGHSRIIKKRFPDQDIGFLLNLRWWDFKDELVTEIVPLLMSNDINKLRAWHKNYPRENRFANH